MTTEIENKHVCAEVLAWAVEAFCRDQRKLVAWLAGLPDPTAGRGADEDRRRGAVTYDPRGGQDGQV